MTRPVPGGRWPTTRVVVVTYGSPQLLDRCLESLAGQSVGREALDVVVVDNLGDPATAEVLTRRPWVGVRRPERNLGFAGGVALGLADNPHPVAVLVNDDAWAEPRFVEALLTRLADPAAAGVGALTGLVLLDGEGTRASGDDAVVNSTGNLVDRWGNGRDRDWLVRRGEESPAGPVFGFCGAAVALRQQALEETGGFDPSLFLYYEDTDLSWRLRAHGWQVEYCPEAVVHHRHAATSTEGSPLFTYYNTRNRALVAVRNAPAATAVRVLARAVLAALAAPLLGRRLGPVERARLRGVRDALLALPRALRGRRDLWAGTPTGRRREVARLLA
ncbi:glycosyltransferase family 2 protein [Thalassiella azotivora]